MLESPAHSGNYQILPFKLSIAAANPPRTKIAVTNVSWAGQFTTNVKKTTHTIAHPAPPNIPPINSFVKTSMSDSFTSAGGETGAC